MPTGNEAITSRLRKGALQLPYLPRALALVWEGSRGWTVAWAGLLLLQGLLPAVTVNLTRLLVDSLVATMASRGAPADVRASMTLAILMGVVVLLGQLAGSGIAWVQSVQAELVRDHITGLVHEKSVAVDLAFYDTSAYYDRLHRARLEGTHRPIALLESIGSLIQSSITLIAMAAVLLRFGWWIPVALLLSTIPAVFVAFSHSLRQHRWRVRVTPGERRAWYYYWLLTARDTAAELRIFGLGDYFRSAYRAVRDGLRGERLKQARDQALAELAAGTLGLIVLAAAMLWLFSEALQGRASLGDLALFYQALSQGQTALRSLISGLQRVYSNSLFLSHLFEFLDLQPTIPSPSTPVAAPGLLQTGIEFRDVTYCYPGSESAAVDDLSLAIPAGTIVALVGPNGAGKSTVIKLLCRLYDPDAGSVTLDNVDIRRMNIDELRRTVTVLFQEPVHYNATVVDNIMVGDIHGSPDPSQIRKAAEAAGAAAIVGRLSDGYETVLGTMFEDGTDLSTGEWQRIALARAFLRRAPIIILDEPTSAMDSWAEADWLQRFRGLAAGRTAVIVTHRFTTAMQADTIHVMDSGRIVESGTHEELVALGGRYAQSWSSQMRSRDVPRPGGLGPRDLPRDAEPPETGSPK